tara:strand:+ start:347 stop:700 length:354 start_codon:yes stop_codon:yes gene_type:complete
MKNKNEKSLGHFISLIFIIYSFYLYFKKDEINLIINLVLLINISITFFYPLFYRPLSNLLIFLGEFIGKIVSPAIFFIIFVLLITPIGLFYRIFVYKNYRDWIKSSEGNDDDFKNEF